MWLKLQGSNFQPKIGEGYYLFVMYYQNQVHQDPLHRQSEIMQDSIVTFIA